MVCGVQGVGFRVGGVGFRVWGVGCGVWGENLLKKSAKYLVTPSPVSFSTCAVWRLSIFGCIVGYLLYTHIYIHTCVYIYIYIHIYIYRCTHIHV